MIQGCFNPSFTGIALVACIGTTKPSACTLYRPKFQSFFYWNCLGGGGGIIAFAVNLLCFNPSFTGIALVALETGQGLYHRLLSFNPSFTGIALVAAYG